MIDPLLFEKKVVPIDVIKRKVSEATNINLKYINITDKIPEARRREFVVARQISMTLAKKYTVLSLSDIGFYHGGRDHATVLHAVKTVNNLVEIHDNEMTDKFHHAELLIRKWRSVSIDKYSSVGITVRMNLIKNWIRSGVPLEIRQQKLLDHNRKCPYCGKIMKIKSRVK